MVRRRLAKLGIWVWTSHSYTLALFSTISEYCITRGLAIVVGWRIEGGCVCFLIDYVRP